MVDKWWMFHVFFPIVLDGKSHSNTMRSHVEPPVSGEMMFKSFFYGWWYTYPPLKNMSSSVGMMFHSQSMESHSKFHGSSHHQAGFYMFLSHWTPQKKIAWKNRQRSSPPDSGQRPSPQGWSHQRWRFRSATPWATAHPAPGHGSQTPPPRHFRTSGPKAEGWQGSFGYNQPPQKNVIFILVFTFLNGSILGI